MKNHLLIGIKETAKSVMKLSNWAKVFIIIMLILLLCYRGNNKMLRNEGFGNKQEFQLKTGDEIYDDFYANTYDNLSYYHTKNEYEMWALEKKGGAKSKSSVLDIGSGTGHHVEQMKEVGITNAMGLDKSKAMISKSKEQYPKNKYILGDAVNRQMFNEGSFTHITCFYFTIYYMKDKNAFLSNCYHWLKPGGKLMVHLVDREMFDPILPVANPLVMVSPQRYAKKRITHSNVVFDDFRYNADFESKDDRAYFTEKFTTRDTNKLFRKNKHEMFMESPETIVKIAQEQGFIVGDKLDMVKAEYEYQYLYIFQKPG